MTHPVRCECGHDFDVPKSLVGGITNCPRCGRATDVEGLNDPMWQALRVLGLIVWAVATFAAYSIGGFVPALIVCAAAAGILLLVRVGL